MGIFDKVSEEYPVVGWCSGGLASAVSVRVCIDLFGLNREINDIWVGVGMRTIETTEELFEEFLKIREV